MNKQELIKKYEGASEKLYVFPVVTINEVLEDLRQLDEPRKVTIPQFVADWIEEGRKHCKDVSDLFDFDFTNEEVGNWFLQEKPFDLVARAWLDGYTVEQDKRYRVKMKKVGDISFLNHDLQSGSWLINNGDNGEIFKTHHTRKELENAGFGWVFECPGMEVEEVE